MADAAIALEIVTPEGVALEVSVDSLTAPSVNGEFGVLPGHRPLFAALKTGLVSYDQGTTRVQVAVGPGFVELSDDKVTLITDKFTKKDDVDVVRVRRDLKEADEALDCYEGDPGGPEHVDLVLKARWAAAQLELYGDPPPPVIQTFHEFAAQGRDSYRGPDNTVEAAVDEESAKS
jgi:F-type H+-transporting ATPase subunit epsilon